MCINKSIFFFYTFSSYLGESRIFDITPIPSFPRSEGTREQRGERSPAGSPDPARSSAGTGPSPAPAPGWGWAWPSCPPWARGFGAIRFLTRLLFAWGFGFCFFVFRHLWSTWRFISLGDILLSPNEARDLSRIPQIKLA